MQKTALGNGSVLDKCIHCLYGSRALNKTLLVMKLTVFLICAALFQARAADAQSVSVSGKNLSLKYIFSEIEKQTGFVVFGNNTVFNEAKPVTIEASHMPLQELLNLVLKDQGIRFIIDAKSIFLFLQARTEIRPDPPTDPIVSGIVRDSTGQPLTGATVLNRNSKKSVQTNGDGEFSIEANAGDILVFSFVGFETATVTVQAGRNSIRVLMHHSNSLLDETVVMAYGTTTKRLATGNITSIKAAEIEKQPVQNPLLALQGRVPGLVITQTTGYEHGPVRIEIRGRNSLNPNLTSDPLIIIDGVPLTILDLGVNKMSGEGYFPVSLGLDQLNMSPAGGQNPLYNLNPSDIESIEVLKDADATAIYGSRGANGVILITSKKGKAGKTRVDIDFSQGVKFITRKWDMLNTEEYRAMRREAFKNDGLVPVALPGNAAYAPDLFLLDSNAYTNWQNEVWGGTGKWTKAQAGISGGTQLSTFRLSGNYSRTEDITTRSGANQNGSLAFNFSNKSQNQRFLMVFTGSYSVSELSIINAPDGASVTSLPPNAPPVFDENGNLNFVKWQAGGLTLPFKTMLQPYSSKSNSLQANLQLSYKIISGLNAKISLGYNATNTNQTNIRPIAALSPFESVKTGNNSFGTNRVNNWIIEPQLEYTNSFFSGRGRITALTGGTLQSNSTNSIRVNGAGYTNDALIKSISNAVSYSSAERVGQYKYTGAFARVNLNWEDKYILSINGRRDGSSRFGAGHQFGNFGSIAPAWILSEEPWMQKILPELISFVKLRGSYGITGSDGIGDYQFTSQWGNQSITLYPYNGVSTLIPLIQPNPDLQWEVNRKMEVSMDLGFFNDRLNFSAAYYQNRCDNQLVSYPTPTVTGFRSVSANSPADVLNEGIEISLGGVIITGKKFTWRSDFNISANRNKLVDFPNIELSPYYDKYIIGQPLSLVYAYHMTGIDPETGKYTYEDHNKDGKISRVDGVQPGSGEDDRYIRINTQPQYFGGLNNIFSYRKLQLSVFMEFKKKIGRQFNTGIPGNMKNISQWAYDNRWQYPGHISAAPALTSKTTDQTYTTFYTGSDAYFTDASYIRLRTVALSYQLPETTARRIGMARIAFTMNAQNLFTITGYKGLDPDVTQFGAMPPQRTITAGFSCSF